MVSHNFNEYSFDEGLKFEPLMPKVMDLVGEDYLIGKSESNDVVVSDFDEVPDGHDQLVTIDITKISETEKETEENGDGDGE